MLSNALKPITQTGESKENSCIKIIFFTFFSGKLDIEIRNHPTGKPIAIFLPFIQELFDDLTTLHVSLSHCQQYATAFAIWVEKTHA